MVDIVGWACHYRSWTAHTVGGRQAWHDVTSLGQHSRSATSCVAFHHRPWTSHTVGRRKAWHDITTLGHHTWLNNVERAMPSSRLASTHDRTSSGMACHHHLWAAQTVERRQAWHEITAIGLHRRSDDVGCGMTSLPLDSTHSRMMLGVAWHHRPLTAHTVERRRGWHDIAVLA